MDSGVASPHCILDRWFHEITGGRRSVPRWKQIFQQLSKRNYWWSVNVQLCVSQQNNYIWNENSGCILTITLFFNAASPSSLVMVRSAQARHGRCSQSREQGKACPACHCWAPSEWCLLLTTFHPEVSDKPSRRAGFNPPTAASFFHDSTHSRAAFGVSGNEDKIMNFGLSIRFFVKCFSTCRIK